MSRFGNTDGTWFALAAVVLVGAGATLRGSAARLPWITVDDFVRQIDNAPTPEAGDVILDRALKELGDELSSADWRRLTDAFDERFSEQGED